MQVRRIEKVSSKQDANLLNNPFRFSNKKEQHSSGNNFQGMLDESIEEIKKEDDSFEDEVNKAELTPRDIQLMELRKSKVTIEQIKNINQENNNLEEGKIR